MAPNQTKGGFRITVDAKGVTHQYPCDSYSYWYPKAVINLINGMSPKVVTCCRCLYLVSKNLTEYPF